jgi:phthalate 4,5-dioxygenase oxygenase subunit
MLSKEENELLCRVGAGTPMGELMRRYWLPACLSEELPAPDCDPVRVRLLGEDLVAFRDSAGRVGLLKELCPHRGASLFLGRNEEGGLRCLYHGWKLDVAGTVLDTPCEPPGSTFKERVKAVAYPVHEVADVVWAYLGPIEKQPPFPNFEWTQLPAEHRSMVKVREECNYLQAVEGVVDSSHADILHSGWAIMGTWQNDDWGRPSRDVAPRYETEDTPYGYRYAAIRKHAEDPEHLEYVRTTAFVMPFHGILGGQIHMFVPMDDEHTWNYNAFVDREHPVDHERHMKTRHQLIGVDLNPDRTRIQSVANNFLQDRAAMRAKQTFSGIAGSGPNQDMAVLESMGPIYDRSQEHLAMSDTSVIHLRSRMLGAVRAFMAGEEPLGLDPALRYEEIRGGEAIVRIGDHWQEARMERVSDGGRAMRAATR